MSILKTLQAYLGWCPMEGQVRRQLQSGSGARGDIPQDGRRHGSAGMKIDTIVKEEFWRSIGAVYWISFLAIGFLIMGDYLPISFAYAFPLAAVLTVAHFLVMVWYRRKENLIDPNPVSILRHALGSRSEDGKDTERRRVAIEKAVDATLLVIIFLIYLYASFTYSISQICWFPVLLIVSMFLTRIVFTDGGERRVTFARGLTFYLGAAGFILLRRLVLGYPVIPTLQGVILVGVITFPLLYLWTRQHAPEGMD